MQVKHRRRRRKSIPGPIFSNETPLNYRVAWIMARFKVTEPRAKVVAQLLAGGAQ